MPILACVPNPWRMPGRFSAGSIPGRAWSGLTSRTSSVRTLATVATELADSGKQVIIAGLDTDFMGRPFAPMPDLLAISESITKMLAICVQCGAPAKHTQRLIGSEDLILVGAADAYEAQVPALFRARSSESGKPRIVSQFLSRAFKNPRIET